MESHSRNGPHSTDIPVGIWISLQLDYDLMRAEDNSISKEEFAKKIDS